MVYDPFDIRPTRGIPIILLYIIAPFKYNDPFQTIPFHSSRYCGRLYVKQLNLSMVCTIIRYDIIVVIFVMRVAVRTITEVQSK